jgi:hypothetical protein
MPEADEFEYTFDNLAEITGDLLDILVSCDSVCGT